MTKIDLDKAAFSLLSEYKALYRNRYGYTLDINKYKEKWGMKSLVEDFGQERVSEILTYYFNKSSKDRHPLSWFYSNFDTLLQAKRSQDKDIEIRKQRRLEMNKIRQEYVNGFS